MLKHWFKRNENIFLGKQKDSIFYLGADTKDREIWLNSSILRQHILVSGTTGAGKTEALLGMFSNTFAFGSGGIYVDGKGDVSLYSKMYALAEHYGRLNDLYVLNFMTRVESPSAYMQTHRFNPFAKGSAESLTNLITSLIPPEDYDRAEKYGSGAKGSAMFIGMMRARSSAMFIGLMRALCWLRDHREEPIDAAVLYRAISLNNLIDFANSDHYSYLPESIRKTIRSYLSSLPSYRDDKGYDQSENTKDQHEFLEMHFSRIFSDMAHSYGHIFCTGESDIDFSDLLWNRRFLCVLLPAMEKSDDVSSTLGRIIFACFRQACSDTLATPLAPTDEARIINVTGAVPFISVFDDFPYYMVDGLGVLASQARGLGIGIVFGCEDIASTPLASCVSTHIIMKNSGSNPELNNIFFDVVSARDDVSAGIDNLIGVGTSGRSSADSPFRSPSSVVKLLNEGDFVLISSGKLLIGRSNYIWSFIPMPKKLHGPPLLHDFETEASRLIELSEKARKAENLEDVPHRMAREFLSPYEYAASATQMLSLALKSLEPNREATAKETNDDEIIKIGE